MPRTTAQPRMPPHLEGIARPAEKRQDGYLCIEHSLAFHECSPCYQKAKDEYPRWKQQDTALQVEYVDFLLADIPAQHSLFELDDLERRVGPELRDWTREQLLKLRAGIESGTYDLWKRETLVTKERRTS